MSYWQGKTALIAGGSDGLGLKFAEALIQAGARCAIVGRSEEKLSRAIELLGKDAFPIQADLTSDDDVSRAVATAIERFGRLDLLANCAGRSTRGEVLKSPIAEFRELLELNFLAAVRCTQAAAPHLIASRGHVVNIGSLASKSVAPYLGAYPASKFALAAFSQQLRWELGSAGVHTLLVCPGPIARDDAGSRYDSAAADLPEAAKLPGGGVKLKGIDPARLSSMILAACAARREELIVPWKAKFLFAIAQISPRWGDWIVRKMTRE